MEPEERQDASTSQSVRPGSASRAAQALAKVEELLELLDEASRVRSEARSTLKPDAPRACDPCRKKKAKCAVRPGEEPCMRCRLSSLECTLPDLKKRGPRRGTTKSHLLVYSIRDDLLQVLDGGGDVATSSEQQLPREPPDSASPDGARSDYEDDDFSLHAILRNPLAVLAHHSLVDSSSPAANNAAAALGSGLPDYRGYYDQGLYTSFAENDFYQDPVVRGILSAHELDRLIKSYFTNLRAFFWHLDPVVHTIEFLRHNSPFLTTVVGAVAASYCPLSSHFAAQLWEHAKFLAAYTFQKGWKSIEVAQAYGFLSHWAPPEDHWTKERSWAWQGQAMRIATEIRIDLPLERESLVKYQSSRALTEDDFQRLSQSRIRSRCLLFCAEIAMGIQSGRMEVIPGLSLAGGLSSEMPPDLAPSDDNFNYHANETLNELFTRALDAWAARRSAKTSYARFQQVYKEDLDRWRARFGDGLNRFMVTFSLNIEIILNLISMRFADAPTNLILINVKSLALRTLEVVKSWQDASLLYASNFVIVNIAYSSTLLLKLAQVFDVNRDSEVQLFDSCAEVASMLERVGRHRPHLTSIAVVHAARIRSLLATCTAVAFANAPILQQPPSVQQLALAPVEAPMLQAPLLPTSGEEFSFAHFDDFDWPASFSTAAIDFLDSTAVDPMLSMTWNPF